MRTAVVVVSAGLVAAAVSCVEIPAFHGGPGDGGGSGSGSGTDGGAPIACPHPSTTVMRFAEGDHELICGPDYAIRLSPQGAGFPSSWVVGGTELLAAASTCGDERGVGVGFYPAGLVNGEPSANRMQLHHTAPHLDIDAPFLVKETVNWTATAACDPDAVMLAGKTSWSMFPNGRVVRFDDFSATSAPGMATFGACTACASPQSSTFFVTSYTAFKDLPLATSETKPTIGDQTTTQHANICANGSNVHLGFSMGFHTKRLRRPEAGVLVLTDDLSSNLSMIDTLPAQLSTMYWVSSDAMCDTGDLAILAADNQIVVGGSRVGTGSDGLVGGDNGTGSDGWHVTEDDLVLGAGSSDPEVPPGSVLWLVWSAPRSGTFTYSGPVTDIQAAPFADHPDTDFAFYFPSGIKHGQTITIHSLPP